LWRINISPNALSKLVKEHFGKALTDLLAERIIVEAKQELYMKRKPIKEIAWHLGYDNEFHFRMVFKITLALLHLPDPPCLFLNLHSIGEMYLRIKD
jgi:YesN/AraC family two-component response regulator